MQRIYRAATLFRIAVRRFLAVSAVSLAANGAWLALHRDSSFTGMCAALATLATGAWQMLLSLERKHEAILARHCLRSSVRKTAKAAAPAATRPEGQPEARPAARPKEEVQESVPALVAQAG